MIDEPIQKARYKDFVPKVEVKRNKKNDSCLNFAHKLELKLHSDLNDPNKQARHTLKKRGDNPETDQFFFSSDLMKSQRKRDSYIAREGADGEVILGSNREVKLNDSKGENTSSYENLIQQAKKKLIRTFLDREKRRQN
jgi:hypothetical protein